MLLALLQLKASPLVLVLYGLFMHCSCTVGRLGGGGAQAWQLGQLLQVGPRKRFLPVLAVKIANCDVLQGAGPDAVDGDGVRIGVGAGAVERADAAVLAEQVFGDPGVEGVHCQVLTTTQQPEVCLIHKHMGVPFHSAD